MEVSQIKSKDEQVRGSVLSIPKSKTVTKRPAKKLYLIESRNIKRIIENETDI